MDIAATPIQPLGWKYSPTGFRSANASLLYGRPRIADLSLEVLDDGLEGLEVYSYKAVLSSIEVDDD